MRNQTRGALVVSGLVGSLLVFGGARPASAAITVGSTGTTMTVTLTGIEGIAFACSSGNAAVQKVSTGALTPASPTVSCASLTSVVVSGDGNRQVVDGTKLDSAEFPAKPTLSVSLGDGADVLTETRQVDVIDMGAGSDLVNLRPGTAPNSVGLGAGSGDEVDVVGATTSDSFTLTSSTTTATLAVTVNGTATSWTITQAERVSAHGGKGNDVFTTTAHAIASSIDEVTLEGEDGNDAFTSGPSGVTASGGSGTNSFNLGAGPDSVHTGSETDTIAGASDASLDTIADEVSLRSGGRTISGFGDSGGPGDALQLASYAQDTVVRVRPSSPAGTALQTVSLNRTGQQAVPDGIDLLTYSLGAGSTTVTPRSLGDVVIPAQDVYFAPTATGGDLYDITIPSGTWSVSADATLRTVTTTSAAVGDASIPVGATYKVHGPWAVRDVGFVHRAYRDLLFRFPTDAVRDQTAGQLKDGLTTRSAVADSLIDTDEYRGLDVDRVFRRYLGRSPDPTGRLYWVSSIRSGKSLPQFRSQLIGSSEYFRRSGETNAGFVRQLYADVLGRAPDPSGLAYWTGRADAGLERGLIARQFLNSSEVRRSIVRDQFLRFLDRPAAGTEITYWESVLEASATGEQQLVAMLVSSMSYYNRT